MQVYPMICPLAHDIIHEGLPEKVIQPGIITTTDVEWWYRKRIRELKLTAWFYPSVSVQRNTKAESGSQGDFSSPPPKDTILPGDLLHVDFGITYLGFSTDTPAACLHVETGRNGSANGTSIGSWMEVINLDILTDNFEECHTGNEILAASRKQAAAQGITPSIYTHPIGFHGHGAGPTIALWDQLDGVPGRGNYPLYANSAYSIELNATVNIQEWEQNIRIRLEEDAFLNGDSVRYIDGHQTELHLIPR